MKIDFIVPTWNSEKTIRDCLESIIKFGNPNKIIIVDNNSTDDTANIANNLGCKILLDTKSLGSARLKGLKEAKTEWIGFVDSDVIISKEWHSRMISYISNDVGAIQGMKLSNYEKFRIIENKKLKKLFKNGPYSLKEGDRGYTDNTIIKRDIALQADIESINAFEDFIITQKVIEKGFKWLCVPVFSEHYEKWSTFIKKPAWHSSGLKYLLNNNKISQKEFFRFFVRYDLWYLKDGFESNDLYYFKTRLIQLYYHWLGLIQFEKLFKLER